MSQRIRITGKDLDLNLRLGEGSPQVDLGSGWEEVARPDDIAITEYVGSSPFRLSVAVQPDGYADDRDIEPIVKRIVKLARDKDGDEPPTFRIHGDIPFGGEKCVLETIEWGDGLRNAAGVLVRQALTLNILEYSPPDRLKIKRKKKGGRRTYTVKEGDTVRSIAKKLAGPKDDVGKLAREIAKLNDIRDIRRELKAGRVLRLP